jgi:hypothetical protein
MTKSFWFLLEALVAFIALLLYISFLKALGASTELIIILLIPTILGCMALIMLLRKLAHKQ